MPYEYELIHARQIAFSSGQILLRHYSPGINFELKNDGSLICDADRRSNDNALVRLQKEFPLDSIISEENDPIIGSSNRCWYVDPLDGTSGFIKNNDEFSIHLGLAVSGIPEVGVVYKPVGDKMYTGIRGVGALLYFRSHKFPLHHIDRSHSKGLVLACHSRFPITDIGKRFIFRMGISDLEITGSEGLRVMRLATGSSDIYVGNISLRSSTWDFCASDAICRAAGAIVQYVDGTDISYDSITKLKNKYMASYDPQIIDSTRKVISSLESQPSRPWI